MPPGATAPVDERVWEGDSAVDSGTDPLARWHCAVAHTHEMGAVVLLPIAAGVHRELLLSSMCGVLLGQRGDAALVGPGFQRLHTHELPRPEQRQGGNSPPSRGLQGSRAAGAPADCPTGDWYHLGRMRMIAVPPSSARVPLRGCLSEAVSQR